MDKFIMFFTLGILFVYVQSIQNADSSDDAIKSMVMNYYTKRNLAALMRQKTPPEREMSEYSSTPYEKGKRNIQSIKSKGHGKRFDAYDNDNFIASDNIFSEDYDGFQIPKRFLGRIPQMGPRPNSKTTAKNIWN